MKLSAINEQVVNWPPMPGDLVLTRVPFRIQWESVGRGKCKKGQAVEPQMVAAGQLVYYCGHDMETERADTNSGQVFVRCEFLYGGLNGRGSIGVASGPTLNDVIGKPKNIKDT